MKKLAFLYAIIFVEGYVVLSAELISLRQVVPFAGSGTDTTSIIIAAVLMPLAIGYYLGGRFKPHKNIFGRKVTIRHKLQNNILIAALIFLFGLSYMFMTDFFNFLARVGVTNHIISVSLYSLIFLVYPVFLLAQTIPLISNFFSAEKLSLITGKMLFFSTIGSFMGAVFTTLVLMATIGVHLSAAISIICLCVLYISLARKMLSKMTAVMVVVALSALFMNSSSMMARLGIIESNPYNIIRLINNDDGSRMLMLNDGFSASYMDDDSRPFYERKRVFNYMQYIHDNFIAPVQNDANNKLDILAIGAGGFTLGLDDATNNYTFIDIDGALKDVAENNLLKQTLKPNKKFIAQAARRFLNEAATKDIKYDLIVIDAYSSKTAMPEHLATYEFYQSVKAALKNNGIVTANFIVSPSFNNAFSTNLDNTLRSVFPNINRAVIGQYNVWSDNITNNQNVIYSYHHRPNAARHIYTDDKNLIYSDRTKPTNTDK